MGPKNSGFCEVFPSYFISTFHLSLFVSQKLMSGAVNIAHSVPDMIDQRQELHTNVPIGLPFLPLGTFWKITSYACVGLLWMSNYT